MVLKAKEMNVFGNESWFIVWLVVFSFLCNNFIESY
jgi:hypothetical protein